MYPPTDHWLAAQGTISGKLARLGGLRRLVLRRPGLIVSNELTEALPSNYGAGRHKATETILRREVQTHHLEEHIEEGGVHPSAEAKEVQLGGP
jgi:hypothetical protein